MPEKEREKLSLPSVCLISPYELSRTHGTGSQLIGLFDHPVANYLHLYWRDRYGGDTSAASIRLERVERANRLWMRVRRRVCRLVGREWWADDGVNARLLRAALGSGRTKFNVAHVVVKNETDAKRALSIVKLLDCPHVVHVMDLEHEVGIEPATMPSFRELITSATAAIGITPAICAELQKCVPRRVDYLAAAQSATPLVATAMGEGDPVRALIVGSSYEGGCKVFAEGLRDAPRGLQVINLHYAGAHFHSLGPELRERTRFLGDFRDDKLYRKALASMHVGLLTGPCALDCYGKYSFPSRAADYLMAGLPIVGYVAPGSSVEQLLQPLIPDCVSLVRDAHGVRAAIEGLTSTPERWTNASRIARRHALDHMALPELREKLWSILRDAARMC